VLDVADRSCQNIENDTFAWLKPPKTREISIQSLFLRSFQKSNERDKAFSLVMEKEARYIGSSCDESMQQDCV
jgi:hypothetical protein